MSLLLGQLVGEIDQFVLPRIGLVLFVLFVATRDPGTLIGGGIVIWLGVGVVAAANTEGDIAGAAVLFGLGVIVLVAAVRRRAPSPVDEEPA